MLNFKAKSHRARSPSNRTDALCIVETSNNIIRVFAQTIPNKKASTLIPIITRVFDRQSIIWTDEHKSYSSLSSMGYTHSTVCHEREFMNHVSGVNTQSVEIFNNLIKVNKRQKKVC
ncbi:hypothetical protein DMUE_5252 [Dictyocoela muelleri]|nr:hypothetical protein DMUE_5252 [Dictyocoela muelleri]